MKNSSRRARTILFTIVLAASLLSVMSLSSSRSHAQQSTFAGDYDRANFAPPDGYVTDPYDPDSTQQGEEWTYAVGGDRLSNGSIIAGGQLYNYPTGDFWLRKYTPTGALDTSFGTNGYVRANFFTGTNNTPSNDIPTVLRVQTDGKIVMAGICAIPQPRADIPVSFGWGFCLMRFNPDGSVDSSFGNNTVVMGGHGEFSFQAGQGRVLTETGYFQSGARGGSPEGRQLLHDMTIQPDGKIVVVGWTIDFLSENGNDEPLVGIIVRYNADGSLDQTFGSSNHSRLPGIAKFIGTNVSSNPNAPCWTARGFRGVTLQPDGRIVAVGFDGTADAGCAKGRAFVITRWTDSGQLETVRRLDNNTSTSARESAVAALIPSGGSKILVSGVYQTNALVRLNQSDLSLDTTFGTGGIRHYGNPENEDSGTPLSIKAIQPDGKILGIYRYLGNGTGVVRFNPNGTVDSSFGNTNAFGTEQGGELALEAEFPQCCTHTFIVNNLIVRPDGKLNLFGSVGAGQFLGARMVVSQNISVLPPVLQFSAANYNFNEGDPAGAITVSVTRSGDASQAATVNFSTTDSAGLTSCTEVTGKASERCDYSTTLGTLRWNAGEAGTKTFTIPIVNDALVEGTETFTVTLSGVSGATLGISSATVTILDNDTAASNTNPIDDVSFFIRQQYGDFLGRTPDPKGFTDWYNTLNPCPNGGYGLQNPSCDRVKVALSTFQSEEFQTRGYWVYKFYEVAFGRRPNYAEFIPDMAQVGGPKSPTDEESAKQQFINAFVLRPEFTQKYNGQTTATGFVDAVLQASGLPNLPIRSQLIGQLQSNPTDPSLRAQVVRQIVETKDAEDRFYNRGLVSMMYFGFMRRDPDQTGFNNYINNIGASGDWNIKVRQMVFDFIYSTEYRSRFGKP